MPPSLTTPHATTKTWYSQISKYFKEERQRETYPHILIILANEHSHRGPGGATLIPSLFRAGALAPPAGRDAATVCAQLGPSPWSFFHMTDCPFHERATSSKAMSAPWRQPMFVDGSSFQARTTLKTPHNSWAPPGRLAFSPCSPLPLPT